MQSAIPQCIAAKVGVEWWHWCSVDERVYYGVWKHEFTYIYKYIYRCIGKFVSAGYFRKCSPSAHLHCYADAVLLSNISYFSTSKCMSVSHIPKRQKLCVANVFCPSVFPFLSPITKQMLSVFRKRCRNM